MVRDVHGSGKQYETAGDLEDAIFETWDKINRNTAVCRHDSIQKRFIDVLKTNKG